MEFFEEAVLKVSSIAERLTRSGLTLGTAESCTGGLLGHLITEFPGASQFYKGGVIAYNNEVKRRLLEVDERVLLDKGAVNAQVAVQMALGVIKKLDCDFSIAISGIAGPGGGTAENPVGTVFFGWASRGASKPFNFLFMGKRAEIKSRSALKALEIISKEINR